MTKHERLEEAEKYRDGIIGYYDELAWARRERETITKNDAFESHGIQGAALEALQEQLANVPLLKSAHLVKKLCKHFPQDTCFVIGVISKKILRSPAR